MPQAPFAVIGALSVGLLTGCANLDDQIDAVLGDGGDEPRTVAFECDDDREFVARLSGDRDEARVDVGGETYDLELADRNGDEHVYSNDDGVRLTVDNREAYLRVPDGSDFQDCERT